MADNLSFDCSKGSSSRDGTLIALLRDDLKIVLLVER